MICGIAVVTYNRLSVLKECLEAIRRQTRPYDHIIVIDNASFDGTEVYLDGLDWIEAVRMNENRGGAGGFEKGLRVAIDMGCDWVTLIDDDAILDQNYLDRLLYWENKLPNVQAMCGAVYNQGKIALSFARRIEVDQKNKQIYESCVPVSEYRKDFFYCNIASFCGMTVNRKLVENVGYPEGDFFIAFDDTEYSMRVREYEGVVLVPESKIDHRCEFVKSGADWKRYYNTRNDIFRIRKHYGPIMAMVYSRKYIRIYNSFLKNVPYTRRQKEMIKAGIRDGLIGKLGKNAQFGPN